MRRLRAPSPSIDGTIFSVAARLRRVDGAAAALDDVEREREVVAHHRVDVHVGLAAHGVDRAVAGRDRRERRLVRAQPHLVAPVEALLVGAGLVDEPHLPADVADRGIGERRDERAQRARLPASSWRPRTRAARRASPRRRRPARAPCRRAAARARGRRRPRARARRWRRRPASAPPSTATTTSSRSRGQSSASAFADLARRSRPPRCTRRRSATRAACPASPAGRDRRVAARAPQQRRGTAP